MVPKSILRSGVVALSLLTLAACGGQADAGPSAAPAAVTRQAMPDPAEGVPGTASPSDASPTTAASSVATPTPAATDTAVTDPAEGAFTKDIMLCFDNKTDTNITWGFERSTSYVVLAGKSTCWPWDGSWIAPRSEFDLKFATHDTRPMREGTILATNPTFGYPVVELTYEGDPSEQSGLRADARRTVTLAGRQFGVNRYPDYDLTWYSGCGNNCSHRHTDSVKHLEVVFYPPAATWPDAPAAG